MRVVLQRVKRGSVEVGGQIISSINNGLVCLVGISRDDTVKDAEWCLRKLLNIRVFTNSEGKGWSKSVVEMNYDVLLVSQFTLYATYKGTKPDFHIAKTPEDAKVFYSQFLEMAKKAYKPEKIFDGIFGAMMDVSIVNDGPVTLIFDSREGKSTPSPASNPSPQQSQPKDKKSKQQPEKEDKNETIESSSSSITSSSPSTQAQ